MRFTITFDRDVRKLFIPLDIYTNTCECVI